MSKSGWCIDEVQALDLDLPARAVHLHAICSRRLAHPNMKPDACDCPNHSQA